MSGKCNITANEFELPNLLMLQPYVTSSQTLDDKMHMKQLDFQKRRGVATVKNMKGFLSDISERPSHRGRSNNLTSLVTFAPQKTLGCRAFNAHHPEENSAMTHISPGVERESPETIHRLHLQLENADAPAKVFDHVMKAIDRLFGYPDIFLSICIFLVGEDGRLYLRAFSRDTTAEESAEHDLGQGQAGWVALHGEDLLIPDFDEWVGRDPEFLWPDKVNPPQSALTVPIKDDEGHVQAVVQVFSTTVNAFHESDKAVLLTVGSHLIKALERLHSRSSNERPFLGPRLLKKIQKSIYDPIYNGTDLARVRQELYQTIVNESRRIIDGHVHSAITIYDYRLRHAGARDRVPQKILRFAAVAGDDWPDIKDQTFPAENDDKAAYTFMRGKQPYYLGEPCAEKFFKKVFKDDFADGRICSVPLRLRRGFKGWLTVSTDIPNAFTAYRMKALDRLVFQHCGALEHLLLLEDTWLSEYEHSLPLPISVKSLCKDSLVRIKKIFGVRACSILLKEPSSNVLSLVATNPERDASASESPTHAGTPTYEIGEGLTGWVAKHRRILRVRDPQDKEELKEIADDLTWSNKWPESIHYDQTKDRAYLAAPLVVRGQLIGVLRLTTKMDGSEFQYSDELLIKRIADPLAVWIDTRWHEHWAASLRMVHGLVTGFEHEIRNTAQRISNHLANLQKQKLDSSNAESKMTMIFEEVDRLQDVCSDLAVFARPMQFKSLDINDVLQKTVSNTRSTLPESVALEEKFDANVPRIQGNDVQLRQALGRLIENAIEAMPDGGTLTIQSRARAERAEIIVQDTGIGMTEEVKQRCREAFYSTKHGSKNTGMGLWNVSGTVDHHSGTIEIQSEVGKGTIFRLSLPGELVHDA